MVLRFILKITYLAALLSGVVAITVVPLAELLFVILLLGMTALLVIGEELLLGNPNSE